MGLGSVHGQVQSAAHCPGHCAQRHRAVALLAGIDGTVAEQSCSAHAVAPAVTRTHAIVGAIALLGALRPRHLHTPPSRRIPADSSRPPRRERAAAIRPELRRSAIDAPDERGERADRGLAARRRPWRIDRRTRHGKPIVAGATSSPPPQTWSRPPHAAQIPRPRPSSPRPSHRRRRLPVGTGTVRPGESPSSHFPCLPRAVLKNFTLSRPSARWHFRTVASFVDAIAS